jgi:hypothetical protein
MPVTAPGAALARLGDSNRSQRYRKIAQELPLKFLAGYPKDHPLLFPILITSSSNEP